MIKVISNFIFYMIMVLSCAAIDSTYAVEIAPDSQHSITPRIVINQGGYRPNWPKRALLINANNNRTGKKFRLINLDNKQKLSLDIKTKSKIDIHTGEFILALDFSQITKPGRYQIAYRNLTSYPFKIYNNAYLEALNTVLRSYYLQRCGVALDDKQTGLQHVVCHKDDGFIAHDDIINKQGELFSAPGGWHDAGDYGKYVASTAVTLGHMLSIYERYGHLFDDQLNIPESGNGIVDIIDEAKFGLDWLLAMQRTDGAVYRKLSGKSWPKQYTPDQDKQKRYVYGISTPETAKFAAVMAMAARVYSDISTLQADIYLHAATKAWQYLNSQTTQKVDWVKGDDSGSGKYLSSDVDLESALLHDYDDRLWAAVELHLTTGEDQYLEFAAPLIYLSQYTLYEWKDPSSLGLLNYLLLGNNKKLKNHIEKILLKQAKDIFNRVQLSAYQIANHRFIWGSNKMTAEEGVILLQAYRLNNDKQYYLAALDQLDYLLGRNHFNMSFVTGIGNRPVKNVMHLYARAIQKDIPGLLVGGPNEKAQAGFAPKDQGPLSYIDHNRSYATNEYAIDYNAAFLGLLSALLATTPPAL